jgi:hypothetical protein
LTLEALGCLMPRAPRRPTVKAGNIIGGLWECLRLDPVRTEMICSQCCKRSNGDCRTDSPGISRAPSVLLFLLSLSGTRTAHEWDDILGLSLQASKAQRGS